MTNDRIARYRAQRDELNARLRTPAAPPIPTQTEARGIPAVNATRVLASVPSWSEVSLRDAHKPTWTLRNLRPRAEKCVSIMPDGTRKDFSPAITRSYNARRTTAAPITESLAATYEHRVAQLGATGDVD